MVYTKEKKSEKSEKEEEGEKKRRMRMLYLRYTCIRTPHVALYNTCRVSPRRSVDGHGHDD